MFLVYLNKLKGGWNIFKITLYFIITIMDKLIYIYIYM